MSLFDSKAKDWDKNVVLQELAQAVGAIITKTLPQHTALSGLEIGSGTGLLGITLANKFAKLSFVDSSAQMLVFLRDKICRNNLAEKTTILHLDIEREELPETYDCIFSQMMLHHVQDIDALFTKLKKHLAPNGFLFFADMQTEDGSFHPDSRVPHNGFDPGVLSEKLKIHGFTVTIHENIFTIEKSGKPFPIFLVAAQL
jgi:2-polyprenyl-3-methyl-5-hydroxy-6-metoxy-1,4-benzoquinol methylase